MRKDFNYFFSANNSWWLLRLEACPGTLGPGLQRTFGPKFWVLPKET